LLAVLLAEAQKMEVYILDLPEDLEGLISKEHLIPVLCLIKVVIKVLNLDC